jgi:hypothetical protein
MVSSLLMLTLAAGEGVFVEECIALGFPVERGERLALAVVHEPGEALPLLEAFVARDPAAAEARVALEMIAYGGHAASLRTLGRLMRIDAEAVRPYVARLLERAPEPFRLAGEALESKALAEVALGWTREALASGSAKRRRQWESAPAVLKERMKAGSAVAR